jgi:GPH family glycoside/pentoside/hexuronide:cation symporter
MHSIVLLLIGNVIVSLGVGFGMSLVFVMISDCVDYGEWKSGVKAEGLLSAAASFGQKVGAGLGTAIAAWLLGFGGYSASLKTQPASALTAISIKYAIVPIIGCVLSIVLMLFYKVDKIMPQMTADLQAKREFASAETATLSK